MNLKKFLTLLIAAIGKAIDSPEGKPLFADQKIMEKVKVDYDGYETFVSRPMLGYSLILVDQLYVKNPEHKEKQRGVSVLTGCHFIRKELIFEEA